MPKIVLSIAASAAMAVVSLAAESPVCRWTGDGLRAWLNLRQAKEGTVENGVLGYTVDGGDASVRVDGLALKTSPLQKFRFRVRSGASGKAEIFWHLKGEPDFKQRFSTSVNVIGDGTWRTYEVSPFWQPGQTVLAIRFDAPLSAREGDRVEISEIAVVMGEGGRTVDLDAAKTTGVRFRLRSDAQLRCYTLGWTCDRRQGLCTRHFRTAADGRPHDYWFDLSRGVNGGWGGPKDYDRNWQGRISWFAALSRKENRALPVENLEFTTERPVMKPDVVVDAVLPFTAVPRVDRPFALEFYLRNLGTTVAKDVRVVFDPLPEGLTAPEGGILGDVPANDGYDSIGGYAVNQLTVRVPLGVSRPGSYRVRGWVLAKDAEPAPFASDFEIKPGLGLAPSSYVPEPKPISTGKYQVGALYFPGFNKHRWERVFNVSPERKPALGWYDETNPEVVDWQIKWLVENGISFLFVDWYWTKNEIKLDTWVPAFQRAKWRKYLKWAAMWTNEGSNRGTGKDGKYCEADLDALARIWTTKYFNTPEYMTVDGKPVLVVYHPDGLDRDMEKGGCKEALDGIRARVVKAGFKGVHFVGLRMPSNRVSAADMARYKANGFDETCVYHYNGEQAMDTQACTRRPYADIVAECEPHWQRLVEAGSLPFMPCLTTGWDDRPWHGDKGGEAFGRTPARFRDLCERGRRFGDAHGLTRFLMGPLNEWGEGSYAEPCREYGFGMYEAIRETFGIRPADGWPVNFIPEDVGRGNYPEPNYDGLPAVKLAAPFTDGAVLQRDRPVPVWGTSDPGAAVTVSFAGQSVSTTADAKGRWRVDLTPLKACKVGRELKVNASVVRDVLVGEVWLCGGQSNMEFPLCGEMTRFRDRQGALVAQMTRNPLVRFANVSSYQGTAEELETPLRACKWLPATPENLAKSDAFSAVGIYYALELHAALDVPVGVIGAYWGGTRIEPWIPRCGFGSVPSLKAESEYHPLMGASFTNVHLLASCPTYGANHQKPHQQPSVLWNSQLAPLTPFAVRGMIWYQGESNAADHARYADMMQALWNGWSKRFENPDLPLYFAQIAPYGWATTLPEIQAAQTEFVRREPHAAMAVINDLGNEFSEIHPNEKELVAKRLAVHALRRDYGFSWIQDESPVVKGCRADGGRIFLEFANAKRLHYYNRDPKEPCGGFEIAGADGVWKPARIAEESLNAPSVPYVGGLKSTVLAVLSEGVPDPVRIRYLYAKPWRGALYNEVDLPLGSFCAEADRSR